MGYPGERHESVMKCKTRGKTTMPAPPNLVAGWGMRELSVYRDGGTLSLLKTQLFQKGISQFGKVPEPIDAGIPNALLVGIVEEFYACVSPESDAGSRAGKK